jgi:eukaryotic-like serine/threonine-protein kinase
VNDSSPQALHLVPFSPGEVLGGKFRIERVLGHGGMGVVVQAMHLQLDQRVALKFLLPDALVHPETVARFAREARAAAKIRSEHVARVIDVGTLDTGSPYIVMEYLEGEDLAAHLRKRGTLGLSEATGFLLQACEALAEAHAAGVVHRDLKPANLFLARYPDGTPCLKILDFGISKIIGGAEGRELDMTRTTAIMGSPYYMSPEQMRSTRSVDARADIWALGVILYELVAGRVPFDADTMPQLCAQVLQDAPPPLGSFAQTGSPTFEAVVLRCLEKDPAQRFQSIAELASALSPFAPLEAQRSLDRVARLSGAPSAPRSGGGAEIAAPMVAAASSNESLTQTDFGQTAQRQKSSRGVLLGGVAATLVAAGVGAWLLRPAAPRESAAPLPNGAASPSVGEGVSHAAPALALLSAEPSALPVASTPLPAATASPAASLAPSSAAAVAKPAARLPAPSRRTAAASHAATPTPAAPAAATPTHPPSALDGRL